jgi:hypothetical protein
MMWQCLLQRLLPRRLLWRGTALPSVSRMQKAGPLWQVGRCTGAGVECGGETHCGVSLCS